MNLMDALVMVSQETNKASQPCDLEIGTVKTVGPLSITRDVSQAPLQEAVLILTENVIEKKIPILSHTHNIDVLGHSHEANVGQTSTDLTGSYQTLSSLDSGIICYEQGKALPVEGGFIIINRALEVGDKVLLLRVQKGQKFIILSRIFEFES